MKTTSRILMALATAGLFTQVASADVSVAYDPQAPEGNFGAPTAASDSVAYTISMTSTPTDVNLSLVTSGGVGLNFVNLYFDTTAIDPATGSDVGFEIGNNDTFTPGVFGSFSTAGDGITYTPTPGDWTISIPWSFFTTDPQALGFTKISDANDVLRLDLSQSFGYSVAGGSAAYGPTELGEVTYSAVPDALSTGAMLTGICGAFSLIRRRK